MEVDDLVEGQDLPEPTQIAEKPKPQRVSSTVSEDSTQYESPEGCGAGGETRDFPATGACEDTNQEPCAAEPCTRDLCWDGIGRREIDH